MISKGGKLRVMGLFAIQPTITTNGVTNNEICVADPTATVIGGGVIGV